MPPLLNCNLFPVPFISYRVKIRSAEEILREKKSGATPFGTVLVQRFLPPVNLGSTLVVHGFVATPCLFFCFVSFQMSDLKK
jgi:hypothetical protein